MIIPVTVLLYWLTGAGHFPKGYSDLLNCIGKVIGQAADKFCFVQMPEIVVLAEKKVLNHSL
jgi:hypothetical protein